MAFVIVRISSLVRGPLGNKTFSTPCLWRWHWLSSHAVWCVYVTIRACRQVRQQKPSLWAPACPQVCCHRALCHEDDDTYDNDSELLHKILLSEENYHQKWSIVKYEKYIVRQSYNHESWKKDFWLNFLLTSLISWNFHSQMSFINLGLITEIFQEFYLLAMKFVLIKREVTNFY